MKISKKLLAKIGISSSLAFLTGLGMMPIFDDDIKSLTDEEGVDWQDNEYISPIIALNTLLVFTVLANYFYLNFFVEDQRNLKKDDNEDNTNNQSVNKTTLAGIGAVSLCAAMLPVSQLWVVELDDQEYVGSSGFDQYIGWATVTSVPVLLSEAIICYSSLKHQIQHKVSDINLDSVGDKLFAYGPTVASFPGRFISYSYSTYFLAKEIGIPEEVSIGLGILIGGVISSSFIGAVEYGALKSLFKEQEVPISKLDVLLGAVCALEGSILALPIVATGMNVIEDQSDLVKSALYAPVFITNSVLKASLIHKAITKSYYALKNYCCVGVDSLKEIPEWEKVTEVTELVSNNIDISGDNSDIYEEIS